MAQLDMSANHHLVGGANQARRCRTPPKAHPSSVPTPTPLPPHPAPPLRTRQLALQGAHVGDDGVHCLALLLQLRLQHVGVVLHRPHGAQDVHGVHAGHLAALPSAKQVHAAHDWQAAMWLLRAILHPARGLLPVSHALHTARTWLALRRDSASRASSSSPLASASSARRYQSSCTRAGSDQYCERAGSSRYSASAMRVARPPGGTTPGQGPSLLHEGGAKAHRGFLRQLVLVLQPLLRGGHLHHACKNMPVGGSQQAPRGERRQRASAHAAQAPLGHKRPGACHRPLRRRCHPPPPPPAAGG